MIRYPLPEDHIEIAATQVEIIGGRWIYPPEDAIPPVPYDGEPPLWHVLDEAIAEADEDHRDLLRGIQNGLLLTGMLALVGLVAWLAW